MVSLEHEVANDSAQHRSKRVDGFHPPNLIIHEPARYHGNVGIPNMLGSLGSSLAVPRCIVTTVAGVRALVI